MIHSDAMGKFWAKMETLSDSGDPDSLARTIVWLRQNLTALAQMRREFLSKYDPARNHRMMLEIHHQAAARRAGADEPELVAAT
jgi:hypothetical protein